MVPADVVNETGVTVVDVREYPDHDEWEVALDPLADLDTGWRPPTAWWDLLIDRAELMWLSDATGSVRLGLPFPALWRHLRPGMTITVHEGRPAVGTATITEASNAS